MRYNYNPIWTTI